MTLAYLFYTGHMWEQDLLLKEEFEVRADQPQGLIWQNSFVFQINGHQDQLRATSYFKDFKVG